jgi:hypothetical protein
MSSETASASLSAVARARGFRSQGAKLTLGNQCFRFAKPSEYEDLEDMTAQSLFPDKLKTALVMLSDGFVDAIMANL